MKDQRAEFYLKRTEGRDNYLFLSAPGLVAQVLKTNRNNRLKKKP